MLLKARPLYDNLADSRLFVTPPQWDQIIHAVERRLNVLMPGPRGSGKTSLLRQAQLAMRNREEAVAFVDGTAVADVLELSTRVRNALGGEPSPLRSGAETAIGAFASVESPIAGASRQLATQLRAIGEQQPTIILLDASGAPKPVYELFGRMRDVLWQQEHRWVVAIDDKDRSTVMRPPADAFFDLVISLEAWSTNDLADLLMRRSDGNPAIDDLVRKAAIGANGNPREALRALSYGVVNEEDPSALLTERAQLLDRASGIGRAPAMLMAELLDRGQANPSDEELQASLGVTRTRLTQLFHQLQDEGLVVSESERANGPGRPRILYRPALSE
jgi:biotin operon repressor/energy-coupling factor transporter ATP-binding protein EcfA2